MLGHNPARAELSDRRRGFYNERMSFAPQQNWDLYRSLTEKHQRDYLRNLTVDQRFHLYQDMYRIVCHGRDKDEWRRLEQRRWERKLALRLRMIKAFAAMDKLKRD